MRTEQEPLPGTTRPEGAGGSADERGKSGARVLVADHNPIYRVGIRRALAVWPEFTLVAEASNAVDALALAASLSPDVIVAATDLPDGEGVELARRFHAAPGQPPVVFLSPGEAADDLVDAVRAGAAALLSRDVAADELVETIGRASRGEFPIDEQVLRHPSAAAQVLRLFGELSSSPSGRAGHGLPLSERELDVLRCMARGKSNKEIGRILAISDQTVKNHISSVLRKLAVSDRTQAVVLGVRRGWIDLSENGASGRAPKVEPRAPRRVKRHVAA